MTSETECIALDSSPDLSLETAPHGESELM